MGVQWEGSSGFDAFLSSDEYEKSFIEENPIEQTSESTELEGFLLF